MSAPDPLAALATACALPPGPDRTRQAVAALAESFHVDLTEVAILRLDHEVLAFVAPDKLRALGTIPLSAANASIAARTALTGRADINNRFAATPHASIFEGVKLGNAKMPIQKLLSAPIARQGQTVGVVQISRKAKTADAVPDFTSEDLSQLARAGGLLAALLEAP